MRARAGDFARSLRVAACGSEHVSPVGDREAKPARARSQVRVVVNVKYVDDEARARRLAELLADLIDGPTGARDGAR